MASAPNPSQRIEIASRFEELEQVVDLAESFYMACFGDDDKVFTGVLLASEAVTNAIEHGNNYDESKQVFIEFLMRDGRAECWVEDQGDGFDRKAVADPLASENLLEDGGRGIFLIERLADQVVYEKGGRRIGIIMAT
jgi:serine/threonine-protein kinase RsbW